MRLITWFFALAALAQAQAASPSPGAAQLLPADTLAVLSVPDWDKAAAYWNDCAYGKLWQDPAMKPFKDKLIQRWKDELAAPLQRELGIQFSDYLDLVHGQVSFAVIQNGWGTRSDAKLGFVLLLDSKDKADTLRTRLAELRKKWVDAGKPSKSTKIRDIECTTLIISDEELDKTLEKAFPTPPEEQDPDERKPEAGAKGGKTEVTFAQSGSLLIVGNNVQNIEKILARQSGGAAPGLAEQGAYEANHTALFREALGLAWVNFAKVYELLDKQLTESAKTMKADGPILARPDKVLAATGLSTLKTVSARIKGDSEGILGEVFLSVPESRRQGVLRLMTTSSKESGPPPFIGADVLKFKRWRMDGQKGWTTIEIMLKSISPEIAGLIQLGLQSAGKERDPNYDLKKALIGNLGDDFISVQKPPRSSNLGDLKAPPSLLLMGSGNPEQLVQGIKTATVLMPLAGGEAEVKDREFLGRKIYSLSLAAPPNPDDAGPAPAPRALNFAATAGYAALSTDTGVLEDYLRSTENPTRPLRELAGLSDAAQKVGGMSTGFFGYNNQAEGIRIWIESAKRESAALDKLFSLAPLAGGRVISPEERKNMKEWMDPAALPPFEKISKYFHFLVYSLSSSEQGLSWKVFAPAPPRVK